MFALHLQQEASAGAREKILTTEASGLPFSTADRDNDLTADVNCAELLSGTTERSGFKDLIRTKLGFLKFKVGDGFLMKGARILQVVGGSAAVVNRI